MSVSLLAYVFGDDFVVRIEDFAQLYGIAHRGRPVGKRLARIVSELPPKPK